ncbi:MAG TPA: superoxide dismutase [Acidimicrobiales bacterium]|nr:superoxide dismutase [Acidimicrobiales bacterium]
MAFELPPLPYPKDALAPHMSEQTLDFHYGKHHQTYVNNLNELIKGTDNERRSLEEIILAAEPGGLFNNAAQAWNHSFFWSCMTPGGGEPEGELKTAIEHSFGSVDDFLQTFNDKAKTLFGSGWTWLAKGENGLEIVQTKDADLPLKHGQTALLTIDVWEHAYYLDYQNARPAYVETWLEHLVNWEFAAANLAKS